LIMIELRWLKKKHEDEMFHNVYERILQYRYYTYFNHDPQTTIAACGWSEWHDVPEVEE